MMKPIRIFDYIEQLDCFVVTAEYRKIANELGLSEWHPAVWIGRLFTLDNDYGEHWFDNWDLRDERETKANKLNIPYEDMLVIDPDRFKNGKDGPCHTDEKRKRFWTDVLKSLRLSYELLFDKAREMNKEALLFSHETYVEDLEERI